MTSTPKLTHRGPRPRHCTRAVGAAAAAILIGTVGGCSASSSPAPKRSDIDIAWAEFAAAAKDRPTITLEDIPAPSPASGVSAELLARRMDVVGDLLMRSITPPPVGTTPTEALDTVIAAFGTPQTSLYRADIVRRTGDIAPATEWAAVYDEEPSGPPRLIDAAWRSLRGSDISSATSTGADPAVLLLSATFAQDLGTGDAARTVVAHRLIVATDLVDLPPEQSPGLTVGTRWFGASVCHLVLDDSVVPQRTASAVRDSERAFAELPTSREIVMAFPLVPVDAAGSDLGTESISDTFDDLGLRREAQNQCRQARDAGQADPDVLDALAPTPHASPSP